MSPQILAAIVAALSQSSLVSGVALTFNGQPLTFNGQPVTFNGA